VTKGTIGRRFHLALLPASRTFLLGGFYPAPLGLVPSPCGFVHHELVNLFLHRQSGIWIFKSHLDLLRTFAMDSAVIFYCNSGYHIAADSPSTTPFVPETTTVTPRVNGVDGMW